MGKELAIRLRADGVEIILDKWHAIPGDLLTQFMETEIRESDFVLIVCSPNYKKKSDNREGGTGYEGDIITGEIFTKKEIREFIPILRTDKWENASPGYLLSKYYINLTENADFETNYYDLLSTLHGKREQPPPIGNIPPDLIKSYQKDQQVINTAQWSAFEFFNITAVNNSESKIDFLARIWYSLNQVYKEDYVIFTLFFSVEISVKGQFTVVNYGLEGHERKFIANMSSEYKSDVAKASKINKEDTSQYKNLKKNTAANIQITTNGHYREALTLVKKLIHLI